MQRRYRKRPPKKHEVKKFRINAFIKAEKVRFIDEETGVSEVISLPEALERAESAGLDLVEVSPKADPPVVKALDYGAFKFNQEKKIKKQRALQKKQDVKGIRLTFRIKGADLDNKRQQTLKFLEAGHNVKIELLLRGRERAHKDKATAIIEEFVKNLGDSISKVGTLDRQGSRLSIEVTKKK